MTKRGPPQRVFGMFADWNKTWNCVWYIRRNDSNWEDPRHKYNSESIVFAWHRLLYEIPAFSKIRPKNLWAQFKRTPKPPFQFFNALLFFLIYGANIKCINLKLQFHRSKPAVPSWKISCPKLSSLRCRSMWGGKKDGSSNSSRRDYHLAQNLPAKWLHQVVISQWIWSQDGPCP